MTARDRFRAEVVEALADWRIGCIPGRPDGAAAVIYHEGIADLARLRLMVAYMPLFQGLERIAARVGVLADLRREPWAQRGHEVNR
jgi:hypothetical protein